MTRPRFALTSGASPELAYTTVYTVPALVPAGVLGLSFEL